MKTIKLTQGQVTLVDDDVYEWASKFKWQAKKRKSGGFNAARASSTKIDGKQHTILLHREIMQPAKGLQVDHRDGNSLDNRRENLRTATPRQNMCAFRKLRLNKSSKFRGVSWQSDAKKWHAYAGGTGGAGTNKYLGLFAEEEEAARAYDVAALKHFGEFAQLNFPQPTQTKN